MRRNNGKRLLEVLRRHLLPASLATLLTLVQGVAAAADGGVTYWDLTADEGSGLAYARTESATAELYREITRRGTLTPPELPEPPNKWRGAPGVALLDADGDGDLDLYVTNGPGSDNSLFSNQLRESGELYFVDVAVAAGVAARDQDSSGVCFGDTDNDGDPDLLVVSAHDHSRFFENHGDGTFTDASATAGLGGDGRSSVACSFGDVDGDGLLDVAVGNNIADWSNTLGIGGPDPFAYNQPNQLFLNRGGNVFEDVSADSGILELASLPPGEASVTWALALVDVDLDGDVDLVHADDQGGFAPAAAGGVDRGLIFLLENDGSGHFTDRTLERGLDKPGGWMGLSFGDLDADGTLDLFATNIGDWGQTTITPLDPVYGDFFFYELGALASRWFLGTGSGAYLDPGVGDLVASEFGWGTSIYDYDNDGDADILFHGGLAFPPFVNSGNPGVLMRNDGQARFTYDLDAFAGSADHGRRVVHGMAVGDLDDDGFTDVASVANMRVQEGLPLTPFNVEWGSPLDGLPAYQQLYRPTETPGLWEFNGHEENADGDLVVEIARPNGNGWVKVRLQGTAGLSPRGRVNRDGIGAVVSFRPEGGAATMRPVTGGASYASQDSLELGFGLGAAKRGQIDVLWPGGVRNRLYKVRAGERIVFPEIPCSLDGEWSGPSEYGACVRGALDELVRIGALDERARARFQSSALRAFAEDRR